ncbi:MAG: exodeoxyribonuclease III [Rhodospirillaceae bacterium]|nr:exodeoxyribonuclease III [Rhodospirillaceae bacterium]|tara:strand:+ start:10573 stop:11370 length:798 start_codon:yes stop_codon:yes gene_type:complete
MRVASWNINSVRMRIDLVKKFIDQYNPDILCLQEIKVESNLFPLSTFKKMGFEYNEIFGQKGYHGVSTHSKFPIIYSNKNYWCNIEESRHLHIQLSNGIDIHNFYVPAGGDKPDPQKNKKFAQKLEFLREMERWSKTIDISQATILLGDLNVAPLQTDVWSHKQLLKVVSHTPIEVDLFSKVKNVCWVDAIREIIPEDEKLFSWWSYRSPNWEAANKGRRLDHLWITQPLVKSLVDAIIIRSIRGWERPSDHVPIIADFNWPRSL